MARIAACAALLGAIAAVSTDVAGSSAVTATGTNTVVFQDVTGEEPRGPDITTVAVSSDGIWLSFRVAIPTHPVVTEDLRIRIWLDLDNSLETGLEVEGTKTGYDHFLILDPLEFTLYGIPPATLWWCEGSICDRRSAPTFSYDNGPSFTINTSLLDPALGLRRIERIRFYATALAGIRFVPGVGYDFTDARLDVAPDDGAWTFDTRGLRIASFRATPANPRTGRPLTLALGVLRTDTGTALTGGEIACSLRVGGRRVPARASRFAERKATCVFDVPSNARGRPFTAGIAVTARGETVMRSLRGRLR